MTQEERRLYNVEWRNTPEGKESTRLSQKKYRESKRGKEKARARKIKWRGTAKAKESYRLESERRRQNPERRVKETFYRRRKLSGFTRDLWDAAWIIQKGLCAICDKDLSKGTRQPCADHNHTTKAARGILCHSCNCAIGLLQDSTAILNKAMEYLNNPPLGVL